MKTIQEMCEVMRAFERGERIETSHFGGDWVQTECPAWDWRQYDYRIAEKPKKKVKLLAMITQNAAYRGGAFSMCYSNCKQIGYIRLPQFDVEVEVE